MTVNNRPAGRKALAKRILCILLFVGYYDLLELIFERILFRLFLKKRSSYSSRTTERREDK